MYETVEFRHLKYFVAIAEEGNFTRAAERLYLAQPSLSTQIKQLEEDIGVVLFVRDFSGVRLTPAGEAFLPLARQLLRLKDRAIETARAVHLGKTLPLQFGFSPFVNHTLAEAVLAIYDRLLPEREIQTTSYSTSHLLEMLSEGSLDAALLTLPVECKVLKVQKIASERILVCMRKDDPLANKPSVSKEAVGAKLRIFSDPKNHPAFYDHLLKQISLAGILAEPSIFVSAPGDVQWMVKLKRGYALVRESVSLDEELTALPITDAELSVESGFVYTQSLKELQESGMLQIVSESCPTKIFLANPEMDRDVYREAFHLNDTELELIAGLVPPGQMLIRKAQSSKKVQLNVDSVSHWMATNNARDNLKKREYFGRFGIAEGLRHLAQDHPFRPRTLAVSSSPSH